MEQNCIFCKMVNSQIKVDKLFENQNMIIIKDINPIAPLHYLLIVKEHYARLSDQSVEQAAVLGECLNVLGSIKDKLGLAEGYRLVMNQGDNGGQTVQHLHIHIVGGKVLEWSKL